MTVEGPVDTHVHTHTHTYPLSRHALTKFSTNTLNQFYVHLELSLGNGVITARAIYRHVNYYV